MRRRLAVRLYDAAARLVTRPRSFAASEEELLAAASAAAGGGDFGEGAWRDGLRVLLRAYDEEARLTPFGRMLVKGELVAVLRNRLLAEAGWRSQPEVLGAPIRRPLFILGLPRTGTTALHFLLAQDPACQVLEYWLAAAPQPRPPRSLWDNDPRFREARRALRFTYWLDPELEAIHRMTADGPEECRHLLQQSFADDTFDSNASVPSYTRWFSQQDMRPAYARHRDLLRLIGAATPERRWVLKYPAHIRNLDVVLETYPDACFVQTHRDPARVLPSLCSLVARWRALYEGAVDPAAIGRWQLEMWAGLMERGIEKRRAAGEGRFFDLHFEELRSDPIGSVKRAYDHFGLELSPDAERAMRVWHATSPPGAHGEHRYRAEDFGLAEGQLRERFARYLDHFGVAPETER